MYDEITQVIYIAVLDQEGVLRDVKVMIENVI